MRGTEAIIGKAPRLGIHTPKWHAAVRPCGTFSGRNVIGIYGDCIKSVLVLCDPPPRVSQARVCLS